MSYLNLSDEEFEFVKKETAKYKAEKENIDYDSVIVKYSLVSILGLCIVLESAKVHKMLDNFKYKYEKVRIRHNNEIDLYLGQVFDLLKYKNSGIEDKKQILQEWMEILDVAVKNQNISLSYHLKELRKQKNITQKDIADYLSISSQAYSNYENGNREPDIKTLIMLAKFYSISIDHLLLQEGTDSFSSSKDNTISELVKSIERLSPEHKEDLIDYINFLKSKNKN